VATTDHTKLLDRARDKGQGQHIQSNISFEKLRTEMLSMSGRHDLAESDLRRVHDEGAQRDLQLRKELDEMCDKLSTEAAAVAAAVASLACSLAEIPRAQTSAARPEPAPGLGGTFDQLAAQVAALQTGLEAEKARTDLVGAAAQEAGRLVQQLSLSVQELQTEARRSAAEASGAHRGPDPWQEGRDRAGAEAAAGTAGAGPPRQPETFRLHTPEGSFPEGRGGFGHARRPRPWSLYDEKYLLNGKGLYDSKQPQLWLQTLRDYLAGRSAEMDKVLDWIEAQKEEVDPA
jgi:hypothetical protein